MITPRYQTQLTSQYPFGPNLLEEQILKLRRPRFDAVLAELKCHNSEHSDFENIVTVNVSPAEYLIIEKICCLEFEERIRNALMAICYKSREKINAIL